MNRDLTVGKPSQVLVRFSLPLLGSIVFQQLYNLADSFVAGKFLGDAALAAVGNAYEVTLIYLAFAFGCNVGCNVVLSLLFGAKEYGDLRTAVLGAAALRQLKDGDTVLISEGCTHHRQCGDIGTDKLPRWVRQYTGRDIRFVFTSGGEFPENLSPYALIIHCGACMLGEREMQSRLRRAAEQCIPVTNYGIAIAQIHGILDRALRPFSALHAEWKKQQQ